MDSKYFEIMAPVGSRESIAGGHPGGADLTWISVLENLNTRAVWVEVLCWPNA